MDIRRLGSKQEIIDFLTRKAEQVGYYHCPENKGEIRQLIIEHGGFSWTEFSNEYEFSQELIKKCDRCDIYYTEEPLNCRECENELIVHRTIRNNNMIYFTWDPKRLIPKS